ncbi:hypothetical protein BHE74_00003460 [Ensete ventricosum]|nr:hypothetical protein BHE74_00003460 [Ensete ventricosum]
MFGDNGSSVPRAKAILSGLPLPIEGSPPSCVTASNQWLVLLFWEASELSPCCNFVGLEDLPILNSARRARSLSSIPVSKASNLAPIRSTDAMASDPRSVVSRSFSCCWANGMNWLGGFGDRGLGLERWFRVIVDGSNRGRDWWSEDKDRLVEGCGCGRPLFGLTADFGDRL